MNKKYRKKDIEKFKFFDTLDVPDEDIIGHRFGVATVVERVNNDKLFRCKCECGEEFFAYQGELLACAKLYCGFDSCSVLHNDRTVAAYVIKKYGVGNLTDFDYAKYGIATCSYCGFPQVWAKGLCMNCYTRMKSCGHLEYVDIAIDPNARRNRIANLTPTDPLYTARVESLSPSKCHKDAAEMKRLYVEDGLTYEQIGDRFGVSRQRVYQLLHTKYKRG